MMQIMGQYYRHQLMMDGHDSGWGFVTMCIWVIVLVLLVAGLVYLFNRNSHGQNSNSPLDIAKERYAKGEIKKDEFEQIKKDLK